MKITLHTNEVDLVKELDFHFDLNEDQLKALQNIASFLYSDDDHFSLEGVAGSGKTTCIKIILYYIDKYLNGNYLLCAPTHKAKEVLASLSNSPVTTLHSILNLKPNVEVVRFDARDLDFMLEDPMSYVKPTGIPFRGYIFIDEASMINDALYNLLMKKCSEYQSKVIFISDSKQIQPVKQGSLSKVYSTENRAILTKVERIIGENPLLDLVPTARDKILYTFKTDVNGDLGVEVFKDQIEFLKVIKKEINLNKLVTNPKESKIITYTNARAKGFTNAVRKILGFTEKEINVGEILTAWDNIGNKEMSIATNSCDYSVVSVVDYDIDIPHYGSVPGYKIVIDALNVSHEYLKRRVLYLIRNDLHPFVYDSLASRLEGYRIKGVEAKKAKKPWSGMYWRKFFEMKDAVVTMRDLVYEDRVIKKKAIDYGYSTTSHKAQGSTYDNVFIDMQDIFKCQDQEELRQLQYVALSRARKKVYLLV